MLTLHRRRFFLAVAMVGLQSACAKQAEEPYRRAIVTLEERHEPRFFSELSAYARGEGMSLVDTSGEARVSARRVGANELGDTLFITLSRDGATEAIISNASLTGSGVSVGFFSGSDPARSHTSAERLVMRLAKIWPVQPMDEPQTSDDLEPTPAK